MTKKTDRREPALGISLDSPTEATEVLRFGSFVVHRSLPTAVFVKKNWVELNSKLWVEYQGEHSVPVIFLNEKFLDPKLNKVLVQTRYSRSEPVDLSALCDPWSLGDRVHVSAEGVSNIEISQTLSLYETDWFAKTAVELPAEGSAGLDDTWSIEALKVLHWKVCNSAQPVAEESVPSLDGFFSRLDRYDFEVLVKNEGSNPMKLVLIRPFILTRKGYEIPGRIEPEGPLLPGDECSIRGTFALSKDAQIHGPTFINFAVTYIEEPVVLQLPPQLIEL